MKQEYCPEHGYPSPCAKCGWNPPDPRREDVEKVIMEILEKWFNVPVDKPCPYCEATEEIFRKLKELGHLAPIKNVVKRSKP